VAPGEIISTIAGTGVAGYTGDGGAGTLAAINAPELSGDLDPGQLHLAVDTAGNLYIADSGSGRLRLLTAQGIIHTIAISTYNGVLTTGDAGPGFGGSGGTPIAVAVDPNGVLYVSDIEEVDVLTPTGSTFTPAPFLTSRVSASGFGEFDQIGQGSWIEIYGSYLAADTRQWAGGDFNGSNAPQSLDGTSVTIGGQPAYISYISPEQINAQVPTNIGTGAQPLIVKTAGGRKRHQFCDRQHHRTRPARPGIFPRSAATQYVVALFLRWGHVCAARQRHTRFALAPRSPRRHRHAVWHRVRPRDAFGARGDDQPRRDIAERIVPDENRHGVRDRSICGSCPRFGRALSVQCRRSLDHERGQSPADIHAGRRCRNPEPCSRPLMARRWNRDLERILASAILLLRDRYGVKHQPSFCRVSKLIDKLEKRDRRGSEMATHSQRPLTGLLIASFSAAISPALRSRLFNSICHACFPALKQYRRKRVHTLVVRGNMEKFKPYLPLLAMALIGTSVGCSRADKSPDVSGSIRTSLDQAGLKDVSVSQDRDKGVVTLTGHVPADGDKAQAASIAKSIAGSEVVSNEVVVMPPGTSSDTKKVESDLDKGIKDNVDAALVPGKLNKDVSISVKNQVVTLTGTVNSAARRMQVQKAVAAVPNVTQVVNELEVKNQKATSSN